MNKILNFILIVILYSSTHPVMAESYDDKIMAIVNDKVILKSEVQTAIDYLPSDIIAKEYINLNDQEIIKKVLGGLIETSLLIQAADRYGINISDIALENKLSEIARSQKMTINELRNNIIKEGQDYTNYIQDIKNQMTVETLFISQFYSRMNVTEEEIENFIERERVNQYGNFEYDLIEFVILDEDKLLEPDDINNIYSNIILKGFINTQSKYSNISIEVKTLGLVTHDKLPNIFIKAIHDASNEEYTKVITSSKGYHVLKILESKNKASSFVNEYKVSHILLKPDVMTSSETIREKLIEMRNEIKDQEDFKVFAKKYSDDKASGFRGGDLGYVRPKSLVPAFASKLKTTPIKKISDPFQSRFGWHILYIENIRSIDDTNTIVRKNIAQRIRIDKAKRERDDWVAKLKDQAYIEIKEF
jgi:peptidyl-prolyl cis-trans isomerase SurA|tara:strand:- start:34 stop:1290 length:1257 start_codon:yes stop_codon:yes gene_type:complete